MRKQLCAFAMLAAGMAAPAFALTSVPLSGPLFNQSVFLTAPTGDSRLFIVEKGGTIKVRDGSTVSTYLDISSLVDSNGERGLLGMAFDPGFASNGRFYVDYIDAASKNTVVSAFTAAVPSSNNTVTAAGQQIISIAQAPYTNHKGGWIGFRNTDPGQLYIATGDGGDADDPQNRAQNLTSNLGKILRIMPSTTGTGYTVPTGNPFNGVNGNSEIWNYGLRNPFRNSFDRQTGDFWIADVGQGAVEEVNFQGNGTGAGANYGWRAREGSADNGAVGDPAPAGALDPFYEYLHSSGMGQSIIGGYVYRGTGEPGLDGTYFFGDFVSGHIFTLRRGSNGLPTDFMDRTTELGTPFAANQLSSFGEDGLGNLYALGVNGKVVRIAAAVPEPETWAMLWSGLALLAACVRRTRRQRAPV